MPAKRVSLKGQGADLFFGGNPPSPDAAEQLTETAPEAEESVLPTAADGPSTAAAIPIPDDELPVAASTALPEMDVAPETATDESTTGEQASYRASSLASTSDGIEVIRRVVKQTGREVSFIRLSAEEKGRLADIVYTYRRQGRKTTENELNRIAINALLEDYDAHGAQSVLARVLDALQA